VDEQARIKLLEERLKKYRKAAALMLADWWAFPADGFKGRLEVRHKALLRGLIHGDLDEILVPPKKKRQKKTN
jgi:hypothetical protein